MAKTVFITGGTGMIGLNLIDQILLTKSGWTLHILYRKPESLDLINQIITKHGNQNGNKIFFIQGDINDLNGLLLSVPENVDYVFHLAAAMSLWSADNNKLVKINVEGTANIIQLCLKKKAQKLIYTSSISAYAPAYGSVVNEDSPKLGEQHMGYYQKTKCRAELEVLRAVRESGLAACVVNPCQVLGKYDLNSWAKFFNAVISKSLKVIGNGGGCFANVKEVALAHIAAAEKGKIGHNYILGGPQKSFLEFATEICKLRNEVLSVKPIPGFVLKSLATCFDWYSYYWSQTRPLLTPQMADRLTNVYYVDSSKAKDELGYNDNIPFEQSVQEEYTWLIDQKV